MSVTRLTEFEKKVQQKHLVAKKTIKEVAEELSCNEVRIPQALKRISHKMKNSGGK